MRKVTLTTRQSSLIQDGEPTSAWVDLLTAHEVPQVTINSSGTRKSWEMGRCALAWWHLRGGRVRLAWAVLRG